MTLGGPFICNYGDIPNSAQLPTLLGGSCEILPEKFLCNFTSLTARVRNDNKHGSLTGLHCGQRPHHSRWPRHLGDFSRLWPGTKDKGTSQQVLLHPHILHWALGTLLTCLPRPGSACQHSSLPLSSNSPRPPRGSRSPNPSAPCTLQTPGLSLTMTTDSIY